MEDKLNTTTGKLDFTRLYFKKSQNKKGEDCFIAKVKSYSNTDSEKRFVGDVIVIANCNSGVIGITKEGRWDVKCKKMEKGTGYVVVEAQYTTDKIETKTEKHSVLVLINGREEKLKTDDNKYIPLSFHCDKWYEVELILKNIERKLTYLQLPGEFSFAEFSNEFREKCINVAKEYKKSIKQNSKKDNVVVVDQPLDGSIERLKNKIW